ncbi:hypothetical protein [Myxococcus sp. RHSTA-1-4]|uniref:hypothetical protein n=1 Tax=Myxococcus sp. RHSTA-1-4 TaxID=2874601 RepID=UPI001CBD4206|nr:hypothetical protein [Myxococcus sp. RHSTA-1-4]MBZ4422743.1 hypothetical protein [Myxococcus sp. RHSTA-1-4]
MSRCLLRGAAPWLAAGVLAAPGLSGMALAAGADSEPSAKPRPREQAAESPATGAPPGERRSREVPEGQETRTRREEPGPASPRGTAEQDEEASFDDVEEDTRATSSREPRAAKRCVPDARFAGLWPRVDDVKFHPTTLEERTAFSKLLPAMLRAAPVRRTPPATLEKVAASVGFRLEVWEGRQDTFWVLREKPGKLRGAGAYVVRTGPATEDIVQVPHPWFDQGTEDIGVGLFACAPEGRRPRLFMTATAHRYHGNPGETPEDPEHPADVAHNPDHLFQEVTNQVARTLAAPRVVQLHGFGTTKAAAGQRDTSLVAVVSSGTRQPMPWARQVSRRLVKVLGEGVRLFPEGVQVLGGTRNAQGRLLQSYECAHFLHLELSAQARKSLSSGERQARMGRVLFAPLED